MPIDRSRLTKDDVVVVPANETVGSILARLPVDRAERAFTFVVLTESATYRVVLWQQVEQIVFGLAQNTLDTPIAALPGLPGPVPAVEVGSMSTQDALELRDEQSPLKVLVVLEDGSVLGLLAKPVRSDVELGGDPFQPPATAEPPEIDWGGTLSPDEPELPLPAPTAPAVPTPQPQPAEDNRAINAWIDGVGTEQPLEVDVPYKLNFNVDTPREGGLGAAPLSEGFKKLLSDPNVKRLNIEVVLDTDDFEIIGGDQQTLVVPRAGKSLNDAIFTILPKTEGVGEIRAMFFSNNRVFQKARYRIQIGALAPDSTTFSSEVSGKTLGSALLETQQAQDVDLVILKKDAGYQFILNSGGFKRAYVNLTEQQIADLVARARKTMKDVVYQQDGGRYVYQLSDTTIPETAHKQALKNLMGTGFDLFEALFSSPGSGADANEMGRVLRARSQQAKLHIAIVAENFSFPWSLLYDRDYDENNVDPQGFWGFKHVIEYTPEFRAATTVNFSPEISVGDKLEMAFVLNSTIDDELHRKGSQIDVVKPQQEYLQQLGGVSVTEYPNGGDLVKLLRDASGKTQLIYFYCHAVSTLPGEEGGVDGSKVVLSDGPVTLQSLKRSAPLSKTEENLQSCPLVFLNACESAELSPYLYDGLVPYLIAKGARGVMGTEVNTPALFAAEFAKTFLQRFTAGNQPIGELLLQMRREYLAKNNVMGLVYALHSGADVVVKRAA